MINIIYDKKVSMMFVFSLYDFIAVDINCELYIKVVHN